MTKSGKVKSGVIRPAFSRNPEQYSEGAYRGWDAIHAWAEGLVSALAEA